MKKLLSVLLVFVMVWGLVGCSSDTGSTGGTDSTPGAPSDTSGGASGPDAGADKDGYVIAFTDAFNGNTFHQEIEQYYTDACEELKAQGIIKDYVLDCANNDAAAQVSQIQNFIMMGVDAIIVDPTSGTALDGAIEEATAAGIPVISFNDGPISSPDAYQILVDCVYNFDYITRWACEKMGGKGDLLLIRGLAGNEYDNQAYQGMQQALADFPDVNVVGEVYGEWNATVAQQEVASILPSLKNVDFVVGQGGDAYGAVQAFQAAGMDVPLITAGHRANFINWWGEAYEKNGYETISGMATPWFGAAAVYYAIDVLDGKDVARYTVYPMELITVENLGEYAGKFDDTWVIATEHDWEWVRSELETQDSDANIPDLVKNHK
ncbi:MAG: ABC transporter substrate-binding protein [Oscillibacter sp.]|nr:ABC transporter substrate-binding protein [Oscillibacter sp.]